MKQSKNRVRLNEEIRVPQVRVIGADGEQVGIMSPAKAIELAEQAELDLVEIAPNATPPVCRIMDYGKFKYQQSKKEKVSKKKQHVIQVKEIRFRPTIDEHDIAFKLKQARKFIEQGNHLRVRILFRGRQIVHPELGHAVLDKVKNDLEDIAKLESKPVMEHRSITATFIPK
ncbi:translation initiation factor IF-3 [bacterium]|nr:translation initiation factor IF-3 [candidate division CSSED10-310 bacterium]